MMKGKQGKWMGWGGVRGWKSLGVYLSLVNDFLSYGPISG